MPTVISIPVWGEEYFDLMNNLMIPSFLYSSKLLEAEYKKNILDIHMDSLLIKKITKSKTFEEISKYYSIELNEIDNSKIQKARKDHRYKYQLYGELHYRSIQKSARYGFHCMPIAPDVIFTETLVQNIFKISEEEKIIFQTSLRIDKLEDQNYSESTQQSKFNGRVTIRQARNLLENHLHREMYQYVVSRSNTNFSPQRLILPFFKKTYLYNSDLHPVFIPVDLCKLVVNKLSGENIDGSIDSPVFTSVLINSAIRNGGLVVIDNDNLGFQLDITKPGSRSVAGISKTWKIKQILRHYVKISKTQKYFYTRKIVLNNKIPVVNDGVFYTVYKIIFVIVLKIMSIFSSNHNYLR